MGIVICVLKIVVFLKLDRQELTLKKLSCNEKLKVILKVRQIDSKVSFSRDHGNLSVSSIFRGVKFFVTQVSKSTSKNKYEKVTSYLTKNLRETLARATKRPGTGYTGIEHWERTLLMEIIYPRPNRTEITYHEPKKLEPNYHELILDGNYPTSSHS